MIDYILKLLKQQGVKVEDEEQEEPPVPDPLKTTREGRIDIYSDTWIFIERWAQEELSKAREANDSYKKNETETAVLRGRIKALKELLILHEPPKERTRNSPRMREDEY